MKFPLIVSNHKNGVMNQEEEKQETVGFTDVVWSISLTMNAKINVFFETITSNTRRESKHMQTS
jgi:hypothetical protein